jgi:Flp pilus assembly protein TadG
VPWVVIPVLVLGGVLILRRALNSSGPKRAEALVAGVLVAAMFFGLSVVVLVLAVEDMQWRADAPARKAAAERDRKMLDDLVAEHAREAERQFHERMAPAQPTATGTTPAEPTP